jgi:hypothetical protein
VKARPQPDSVDFASALMGGAPKARDWHAERYAAGEALAKAARAALADLDASPLLLGKPGVELAAGIRRALAEYERTKDAP